MMQVMGDRIQELYFRDGKKRMPCGWLALAVGQILTENGMDVSYTRVTDRYHTPGEKAEMANYQDSDYLYSQKCHLQVRDTSGIQTLIYDNGGAAQLMASEINKKLTEMGWKDLGVMERPGIDCFAKNKNAGSAGGSRIFGL